MGDIHLGPSWPDKNKYSSTEVTLLVITYDCFYINFEWSRLEDQTEEDLFEFISWLASNDEFGLPIPYKDDETQEDIKKISEWSDEEKQQFESSFVENWEIGTSDLHTIVSEAYPNYIGGEWVWTSWKRIKNNM